MGEIKELNCSRMFGQGRCSLFNTSCMCHYEEVVRFQISIILWSPKITSDVRTISKVSAKSFSSVRLTSSAQRLVANEGVVSTVSVRREPGLDGGN